MSPYQLEWTNARNRPAAIGSTLLAINRRDIDTLLLYKFEEHIGHAGREGTILKKEIP